MFKRVAIIFIISTFLVGCWDERLYKNLSVVSLAGIEGQVGEMKGYYAYPTSPKDPTKYKVIEGEGISPRDVRNSADLKVEQTLDLSELGTILLSKESAKNPIYDFLDVYFRNPENPISSKVALTDGSVKDFLDIGDDLPSDIGEYYLRFIESFERNSIFPKQNIQHICSLFFGKGMDPVLPFLKKVEKDRKPVVGGLALFNKQVFTGTILDPKESLLLVLLMDKKGESARFSYLWENKGKKSPITADVVTLTKRWNVEDKGLTATVRLKYKLKVNIEEFPPDHLHDSEKRIKLEKFLSKKVQKDIEKLLHKLQDAKSDPLGIGQDIRAFHPKLWDDNWGEKFAELTLKPDIKVSIVRTGVLR
ncbi:Ger(x)C family spore germination protein [Viridibacillus arvi]|uniref:Ger(x)C family spore germination protein n=1 Tax=Viridibacillus arvi TaxID=263475 RepID=UPI003D01329E